MEEQKEEIIQLLITHHQLLMEQQEHILQDPYLRSCKLPLAFKFGALPAFDLRLGHLLLLWKQVPVLENTPVRILEARNSDYYRESICYCYNTVAQKMETKEAAISIRHELLKMRNAFQKQRLSVDLERLLLQLQQADKFSFSQQLKAAHQEFKRGMKQLQPRLSKEKLQTISLHMTPQGLVRIIIKLPYMGKHKHASGPNDHNLHNYNHLLHELLNALTASTGFLFLGEKEEDRSLILSSQALDPYEGNKLYAPQMLQSISLLLDGYLEGMKQINRRS